jgi:hypothetical protein
VNKEVGRDLANFEVQMHILLEFIEQVSISFQQSKLSRAVEEADEDGVSPMIWLSTT